MGAIIAEVRFVCQDARDTLQVHGTVGSDGNREWAWAGLGMIWPGHGDGEGRTCGARPGGLGLAPSRGVHGLIFDPVSGRLDLLAPGYAVAGA